VFLSQILVNPGSHPDKPRPGLNWIKQTYRVHQRIWMAFPDAQRLQEGQDPFFLGTWSSEARAKPRRQDGDSCFEFEPDLPLRILVQSSDKPNWDYAFQNAPHLIASPPANREFTPSFSKGESYRFRLAVQMVTRQTVKAADLQEGQKAKSEHPIRCLLPAADGSDQRESDPNFTAWRERLATIAERSGFGLGEFPEHLRVQPATNLYMKPEGRNPPKRFNAAMFDGILTCKDPQLLREAVVNGIGRGKAFGMGLLSLAVIK